MQHVEGDRVRDGAQEEGWQQHQPQPAQAVEQVVAPVEGPGLLTLDHHLGDPEAAEDEEHHHRRMAEAGQLVEQPGPHAEARAPARQENVAHVARHHQQGGDRA